MNFYTLTFRNKIIASLLLILVSLIIVDIGLYFVAKMKTTKTTFINEKFSKLNYLQQNSPQEKDIIFIGSSRTFYHISTNVFKNNLLDVFNLGVSGVKFEDFPASVPYVNNLNPKRIIISLPVYELYNKLNSAKYPSLNALEYYYGIDKIKFLDSLKQWIINRHLFLQHSKSVFYNIKSTYNKFNIQGTGAGRKILNDRNVNYSALVNCKVFGIKEKSDTNVRLKCTNGDGVLIGSNININNVDIKELKVIDQQSIKYIQNFIRDITKNKTKISIILEPILHNEYSYNINDIKNQFEGIEIIDLTNLKIQDGFWFDNYHLNYKGREQYSQYLSDILK